MLEEAAEKLEGKVHQAVILTCGESSKIDNEIDIPVMRAQKRILT